MKTTKTLIINLLLFVGFVCRGQEMSANIFVDSTGQVYVQTSAPVYFFVAEANNEQSPKTPIPSSDPKANPMFFDGNGVHFIQYKQGTQTVKYKVIADGQGPRPKVVAQSGLLLARKNRIYADTAATFIATATDAQSGTRQVFTSINGSPFSQLNQPFTLQQVGQNQVRVLAIDNVGNVSDTSTFTIIVSPQAIFHVDNIHFETASARLLNESQEQLAEMLDILKSYPELRLQINAHADTRGNSNMNRELSQRRAMAVLNYLTNKGIQPNRLKAIGHGDTKPLNECLKGVKCTDLQHRVNRRVEFNFTLTK